MHIAMIGTGYVGLVSGACFADFGHDEDMRNYEVSYAKLRSLGFETAVSVEDGIHELIRGLQALDVANPYSNVYV